MARQNEVATRRVAQELGIELVDVADFACCGFPIKSVDVETALLLAARNLSLAEQRGLDICTICSGCAGTLLEAQKELEHNEELRRTVNKQLQQIGREYHGDVKIKHFAKILRSDVGLDTIKGMIKANLENLTIATHYGCHYHKPSHTYGEEEDVEFPTSLDELIAATGAKNVDYAEKMECCGGNVLAVDDNITIQLASQKLDHVKQAEADAINLVCPLCDVIFDRNQRVIERRLDKNYGLPVLFYPQVLGLALGITPKELGLDMNRVKVTALLDKI
jgi:heterodisulfide reductase subunit B